MHNVNISTAVFYNELNKLKFNNLSFDKIIEDIILRENNSYIPEKKNFLYFDGNTRLTDQNHLAFQAWCMMQLPNEKSNSIGREIIDQISFNREKTIKSLIGHLRILPYNEFNKDSLIIYLENIVNNKDTIYKSGGYDFSNPRIKAQIAVGAAYYFNFKLKNK